MEISPEYTRRCDVALPVSIVRQIEEWVIYGTPLGGFLLAVAQNNLQLAAVKADRESYRRLLCVAEYFRERCPSDSWGSPGACARWSGHGGLLGVSSFDAECRQQRLVTGG